MGLIYDLRRLFSVLRYHRYRFHHKKMKQIHHCSIMMSVTKLSTLVKYETPITLNPGACLHTGFLFDCGIFLEHVLGWSYNILTNKHGKHLKSIICLILIVNTIFFILQIPILKLLSNHLIPFGFSALLGTDFFDKANIVIDYKNHRLHSI